MWLKVMPRWSMAPIQRTVYKVRRTASDRYLKGFHRGSLLGADSHYDDSSMCRYARRRRPHFMPLKRTEKVSFEKVFRRFSEGYQCTVRRQTRCNTILNGRRWPCLLCEKLHPRHNLLRWLLITYWLLVDYLLILLITSWFGAWKP